MRSGQPAWAEAKPGAERGDDRFVVIMIIVGLIT